MDFLGNLFIDFGLQILSTVTAAFAIAAIGLNLHFGYTGLINIGQAGFMLLGAYGFAITVRFGGPFWLAVLVAIAAAVLFALILGLPTLKLRGDYLAIVTIAAAEIIRIVGGNQQLAPVTGGVAGIGNQVYSDAFTALSPFPQDGAFSLGPYTFPLTQGDSWFLRIVCWVVLAIVLAVVFLLMRSPWGRTIRGIREDEDAVRSLGKNVYLYKMQSLVLGGVIGAVGGVLFVLGASVQPDSLGRSQTFLLYTIVLLGGAATVFGPVLGSVLYFIVIIGLQDVVSQFVPASVMSQEQIPQFGWIVVGVGLMLLVIFRPQGILGNKKELSSVTDATSTASATADDGYDYDRAALRAKLRDVPQEPGSAKPQPILAVDHVVRRFGGMTAVDVDHLEVQRGAITALIGPNGAGKTTFFNLITGFDKPSSAKPRFGGGEGPFATWRFQGASLGATSAFRVAQAGMVRTFQLTKALEAMTVMDNMLLGAKDQPGEKLLTALVRPAWRRRETEIRQKAEDLLARFKLDTKQKDYAGSLSGGQRKLLEMARALMSDPAMIMLDEPMAGVNPALTQSLLGHIQDLRDRGTTVLFVEHDMHMVRHISDWVVVMAEGKVVAEGPPEHVMQHQAVVDAYLGSHHDQDLGDDSVLDESFVAGEGADTPGTTTADGGARREERA